MDELHQKKAVLLERLKNCGSVAVAFSAGVDSAFLLACAAQTGIPVLAVTLSANAVPRHELEAAAAFCRERGIPQRVIEFDQFTIPAFVTNAKDRCYHCKKALFTAVIQTVIVLSVSYALSRLRFKGRKLIMNTVLVLGLFPGFLTMITLYFLLKQMGLTQAGAVPGLILIYCASSGMGYYISKGFFDTIPKSLDESARIDGATRFQVFLKIIMPLAKPIVIYTVLMAFMAPWGDYVFASYVAFGHQEGYNVAVGLYNWVNTNDFQNYFTRFCAGGVLVAVPITALFMALQKYYVEGVTGGAVKG